MQKQRELVIGVVVLAALGTAAAGESQNTWTSIAASRLSTGSAVPSTAGMSEEAGAAQAMAAGSFVGLWTCSGAATPVSGAFQTVISIYANGSWQMQESIAPARNLVGAMVRGRGNYQQTGADSLTLNFLEQAGSSDGVNWVPAPVPAPWTAKLEGNGLNVGGTLCHRSG